jgi:hypothetical protein
MTDTFIPTPALERLRGLVGRVRADDEALALDLSAAVGDVLTEAESGAVMAMLDGRGWRRKEEVPITEEVALLLGEKETS